MTVKQTAEFLYSTVFYLKIDFNYALIYTFATKKIINLLK